MPALIITHAFRNERTTILALFGVGGKKGPSVSQIRKGRRVGSPLENQYGGECERAAAAPAFD